ncbi:MAG TPA: AAA family ATPase [Nostocaceae cyanobacterium]|nr:AAA family ATPase [Nostocaceae cyanobacterium]
MINNYINVLDIPGYRIIDTIYVSNRTIVYRGEKEQTQTSVVIKVLNTNYPELRELIAFKNQYNIIQQIEHPNIIKCYALEAYGNSYALILEDFGGIALSEYTQGKILDLPEFFRIGCSITEALECLYQNKVIHKDIKPKNILINPNSKQIKLIDFSISSFLPKESTEIKSPNVLEGTLIYMSPEQTGRMNRGIDYRADFYSLGVTFYELLTGNLPFNSNNPLELIHCHLAQEPINPQEINPQIPSVVANIILKLMAKTAEERYQTARGIKHDLEICQQMLLTQGEVTEFTLGEKDQSDRFLIPEKLYGRETEVTSLLNAFERVSAGNKELMLVSGFSGIGKTAIVNEINKPIVRQKGYFISGKYDQFQKNIPFSALLQAFRSLMKQLLTENTTQLQQWKKIILSALGEQGQVIIEVIPELEKIIGKQPKASQLTGNASQNRFNLLLSKFIQVLATQDHPLVIFLDDLQWADAASLKLIQSLMTEIDVQYLLLIVAYRDNEVQPGHSFMVTVEDIYQTNATINQINLHPLNEEHLNHLVSDTLRCTKSEALPLTKLVFNKTKGNPFFTNQLLKSLHDDELITFNYHTGYWQYNLAQAQGLYLSDNIIDFLKLQLQKLPEPTQNILKVAACIGNKFDLYTLSIVSEKPDMQVGHDLWPALQEGLILPKTESYKFFTDKELLFDATNQTPITNLELEINNPEFIIVRYNFLHDRIQQAAYNLIPENERQLTHLKIGNLILQNTKSDDLEEKIFAIVNQLNIGSSLIDNQIEKYQLAKLNLLAGHKAKSATAYEAAIRYLNMGLSLLVDKSWYYQYHLTLNLHIEAIESEYLNSNFEQCNKLANFTLKQTKTILDEVKVYKLIIQAYLAQNRLQEAVETGIEVLKKLDVKLPHQAKMYHVKVAFIQTKLTLFGKKIEDLAALPMMKDPYKLAAMQILLSLAPATSQAGSLNFLLIILAMVRLSVQYGNSPFSTIAYNFYGGILCDKLGDIETGYKLGMIGLDLLEKTNGNFFRGNVSYIFNAFIRHFKENLKSTITPIKESININLENGEIEFASYCISSGSISLFLSGENLDLVEQQTLKNLELSESLKINTITLVIKAIRQGILNLQGYSTETTVLIGKEFNELEMLEQLENNYSQLSMIGCVKIILNYLFSNYVVSAESIHYIEKSKNSDPGFAYYSTSNYYHSLSLLALYNQVLSSERKQYLKQVEENQKKMKKWAFHAPCNYKHKYDLVEAEKARVLDKHWLAAELYDQAIKGAKENGYIQEEAIANELAAKFYLARGKETIAQGYLVNAYYSYMNWGAKAKVEDIERSYPYLLNPILKQKAANIQLLTDDLISNLGTDSSTTNISALLDLETVTKAALAISSEIHVDKLIYKLMQVISENVGAEKACLIFQREDNFMLVAKCQSNQSCEIQSTVIVNDDAPLSLINYVANTQEDVLINNATIENDFTNDVYIIKYKPKSILCTPILNQGQLIGIFYLENTLIVGAFTTERLKLLKLISSQAAISLTNAQVYDNLEEKVAERTKELNENNQRLQQALNDLKLAQTQLIQSEKMSSLGQMVAGVAHEINNPVSFIYTNIEHADNYIKSLLNLITIYQQEYPEFNPKIQDVKEELDIDFLIEDLAKILASMKMGANRIRKIVLGLRNFSRLDEAQMKNVDIHEGLESTLMLIKPQLRDKLTTPQNIVVKNYGQLPLINCYAAQLNQVFMNIFTNAIDALQQREQQLSVAEKAANPSKITISTQLINNDWVRITIKDNALGISPEVQPRIFDPFFTTKPVGEGVGLGLSICYQIVVQQHRGKLECISTPGEGTEFLIEIPISLKQEVKTNPSAQM